ncbi:early nodulin-like protein 7 [Primulina huaijiensis]|uniref:early nodulin-like protein 7 n=1 Tax=Primulina huaijiensis TaxID=1492673 RepID=UPI003CC79C41
MKLSKMETFLGFPFAVLIVLSIVASAPAAAAEEFKVGEDQGWRQPAANETDMYSRWAATKRFHVGDSLRFEYKSDTVQIVDKWGYYHCNSTRPISVFNDGHTLINLDLSGPLYIVSADPDHCKSGQRMIVEVISVNPRSPRLPSMDASPAPSPYSSAGTFSVVTEVVFFYVVFVAVSVI